MAIVRGEQNQWQTGGINGRAHAIEMCGSQVKIMALCDTEDTANLLVEALKLLKDIHDLGACAASPRSSDRVAQLLERAGLV